MKAITTRHLGQTETRPARIIASDLDGHRLIVAWERDAIVDVTPQTQEQRHRAAALAFRDSMRWTGDLVTGAVKHGYVHVFTETPPPAPVDYAPMVEQLRSWADDLIVTGAAGKVAGAMLQVASDLERG